MDKLLLLAVWFVLVPLMARPVRGRGIPVGHGIWRWYFRPRQAVVLGSLTAAAGAASLVTAGLLADRDLALLGLALAWLGGVYAFHGLRHRVRQPAP
jgi:hypothetical protein